MNLPVKVTFAASGNIAYIYNAQGQKLKKIVSETGKAALTTDYLGGYQYENGVMKFFPTAEGYVEPSAGTYKYVYQYKDHLGALPQCLQCWKGRTYLLRLRGLHRDHGQGRSPQAPKPWEKPRPQSMTRRQDR